MQAANETIQLADTTSRVALITGDTTGISKETALILARNGVNVVVSGRRQEAGEQLIAAIKVQGGEASFVFGDVNEERSVRQLIEFTVQRYGRLDMAVNNAGIALETKRIGDSRIRL